MKSRVIAAVAAAVIVALAGPAFAGGTATVNVSANIVGTCQFTSTPALAFGALDQTSAADATATGILSFWCTKNAAYTLSDEGNVGVGDGAFNGTIIDGVNSLPYSISYDNFSGSGNGKTTPVNSTLTATIANVDYVDAPAGNYAGTVQFTIAP